MPLFSRGGLPARDTPLSIETMNDIAKSVSRQLGKAKSNLPYVFVGLGASHFLGCPHNITEIELLVPDGYANRVAEALGKASGFSCEKPKEGDRYRVRFKANKQSYPVAIVEAKAVGVSFPRDPSCFLTIRGARILKPTLLLNYQCGLWMNPDNGFLESQDRLDHTSDILFLVCHLENKKVRTSPDALNHVTKAFLGRFLTRHNEKYKKDFVAIGLMEG